MSSTSNKKVTVMSHGKVQGMLASMDLKNGKGAYKQHKTPKQASMKGSMDKNGNGQGKID